MESRLLKMVDLGRFFDSNIDFFWHHYQHYIKLTKMGGTLETCEESRYVCGYPVPHFQRQLIWSTKQQIAFIESAMMGLPIGILTIHEVDWIDYSSGNFEKAKAMSGWVIDGQQRLNSLQNYFDSKLKVCDLYWSELQNFERSKFKYIKLGHKSVVINDEAKIKDLYNRMNFSGTSHELEQKAV